MLKKEIKSGIIMGLSFLITITIGGVVYAAVTLTATSNEVLTADKWNYLVANTARPSGEVAAFDLSTCPDGWTDYTPAYGRFLRGIDKSGSNIDPDGKRANGSIQEDIFKSHSHTFDVRNSTVGGGTASTRSWVGNASGNSTTKLTGGLETRPKNVAVLYCRKD